MLLEIRKVQNLSTNSSPKSYQTSQKKSVVIHNSCCNSKEFRSDWYDSFYTACTTYVIDLGWRGKNSPPSSTRLYWIRNKSENEQIFLLNGRHNFCASMFQIKYIHLHVFIRHPRIFIRSSTSPEIRSVFEVFIWRYGQFTLPRPSEFTNQKVDFFKARVSLNENNSLRITEC